MRNRCPEENAIFFNPNYLTSGKDAPYFATDSGHLASHPRRVARSRFSSDNRSAP